MANIYQIGSGMVGSVMALDLAKDHNVFLADNDEKILSIISSINPNIKTTILDASNHSALNRFIQPADIVLLAVPGFLGYKALKTIIKANKNVVDISFSPGLAFFLVCSGWLLVYMDTGRHIHQVVCILIHHP